MGENLHPTDRKHVLRFLNPAGRIWLRLVARLHEYASDLAPGTLNLSWITQDLAVGGSYRVADIRRLAELGVRAVVDAREEASDDEKALARHGIELLRLPTPDRYALSADDLAYGVEWALGRLDRGEKVFVHCEHGVGRGPLLGAAILVGSGNSASDALRLIRSRRWQAAPNDRQLEGLLDFEQRLRAARAATPEEATH